MAAEPGQVYLLTSLIVWLLQAVPGEMKAVLLQLPPHNMALSDGLVSAQGTEERAGKLGSFGFSGFVWFGFLFFLLSELCKKKKGNC